MSSNRISRVTKYRSKYSPAACTLETIISSAVHIAHLRSSWRLPEIQAENVVSCHLGKLARPEFQLLNSPFRGGYGIVPWINLAQERAVLVQCRMASGI